MRRIERAIRRYEAAKLPGFIPKAPKVPQQVPTLAQFLSSREGHLAMRLLATSDREIMLGQKISDGTISGQLVINGRGLRIYSSQELGGVREAPVDDMFVLGFINGSDIVLCRDYRSLVTAVRAELISIADAAP